SRRLKNFGPRLNSAALSLPSASLSRRSRSFFHISPRSRVWAGASATSAPNASSARTVFFIASRMSAFIDHYPLAVGSSPEAQPGLLVQDAPEQRYGPG